MPQNTMTPEGAKVDAFVNAAESLLLNLWSRWQDEHEYEDIKDYAKPLMEHVRAAGLPDPVMVKRPFGCKFTLEGKTYQVKVTSRTLEWKRIK
jgi:hypothetical protein